MPRPRRSRPGEYRTDIIHTLLSIDFRRSQLPAEILNKKRNPQQPFGNLELDVRRIVYQLENDAVASNGNLRLIDEKLWQLAMLLEEAVALGKAQTALTAVMGLEYGVKELRCCVPCTGGKETAQFIDRSANCLEQWEQVVTWARMADQQELQIERQRVDVEAGRKELEQQRTEIIEQLKAHPEGQKIVQLLHDTGRNEYTPEEWKWR